MNDFHIKSLLLKGCMAIALSGCASKGDLNPVVDSPPTSDVPSIKTSGHKVTQCESTQRDLTIPWTLRQYWCGDEDRLVDLQSINDGVMSQSVDNQLAYNQNYLDEVNKEVNQSQYDVPVMNTEKLSDINESAPDLDREVILKRLKSQKLFLHNKKAPAHNLESKTIVNSVDKYTAPNSYKVATGSDNKSVSINSIVFARHLRVLGPQGRTATHALMNQVVGAEQILLRGLILPDEVLVDSALYREKVSVGRALAVRKYWEEQGLDISHIKILHHKPELTGRAVEVVFHG